MMRTAEGTRGHKPCILAEQPRDAVYLCDLDGFFLRQFRQNRTHPTCQHRLARTGYTDHQNIMPSCRRNLKRTFRLILPLYVRKVIGEGSIFFLFCCLWHSRSQHLCASQMTHKLCQILDGIDLQPVNQECLVCIRRCNVKLRQPMFSRRDCHRENAADRSAVPIEGKLCREKRTLHCRLGNHTVGCKETNRNWQIKPRTVLSHIGRCEIDRNPLLPQLHTGVANRSSYPLLRFLHRRIGKPDQLKARQPGRHIHLNVDNPSIYPEGRRTIGLCKQRPSLLRFKYKKIITQDGGSCLMILCKRKDSKRRR